MNLKLTLAKIFLSLTDGMQAGFQENLNLSNNSFKPYKRPFFHITPAQRARRSPSGLETFIDENLELVPQLVKLGRHMRKHPNDCSKRGLTQNIVQRKRKTPMIFFLSSRSLN